MKRNSEVLKIIIKLYYLMVLLLLIFSLMGCGQSDEEKQIGEKASKVAVQHMKDEYGVDLIITKTQMMPPGLANEIVIYGQAKEDPAAIFDVKVDYRDGYKVTSVASGISKEEP